MKTKALSISAAIALFLANTAEAGFFVSAAPRVSAVPPRVLAAEDIPSRYDLRETGRITPIRTQNPWKTCWAHAAVASVESNYLTTHTGTVPGNVDFSEMMLVWFSRINQDKSRSFSMYTRNRAQLIRMGDYGTALNEGAFPNVALASLARLDNIADEQDFPYLDSTSFIYAGYSTGNPPTHSEAENAGLIPLRSSAPSRLVFSGRTATPRSDLRMTGAYFAAANAVPAAFANQRRDYAEQNKVSNDALKALIMHYGAAMIGYYSDERTGSTLNSSTHGYNISDPAKWKGNHEITVIGWDDDYSRDNFIDKPQNNGAWLARNSWGNFAGSDGGYEWISYEMLIGDGVVCEVEDRPENLHVYEYDPLGWCNSFMINQPDIWAANVFRTDSEGETLESVGFYTSDHNTRVNVKVYDLGASFGGTDPTAGSIIYSAEEMMNYAGYHTIKTYGTALTRGNYFSVVIQFTNTNGVNEGSAPVEVAIKRYSDNVAVYDKESFFSDDGTTWTDGTDMVDDFRGGIPYHVNACIKAFTVAPNFTGSTQASRSIMNIPVETFTPAGTSSISSTIPSASSKTASVSLNSGANADVSVYLVDKSRTYEPLSISEEEQLDSEGYPKGRTGPIEWVVVPVYKTGYKPDFFWNDAGINYPVYGPFSLITNKDGVITVDVDALEYPDGSRPSIPESYYTIYCVPSSGTSSETGVVYFSANGSGEDTPTQPSDGGSGGGGGCSAGISVLGLSACLVCLGLIRTDRKQEA